MVNLEKQKPSYSLKQQRFWKYIVSKQQSQHLEVGF